MFSRRVAGGGAALPVPTRRLVPVLLPPRRRRGPAVLVMVKLFLGYEEQVPDPVAHCIWLHIEWCT